jgi:hypothetical protein
MWERTSDAYRVQAKMMTGKATPRFNQAPAPSQLHTILRSSSTVLRNNHAITCSHSITCHNPSTIPRSIIRHHNIMRREVTEQATEEEDEPEEVSYVVEDQSHVTNVSNREIMHGNAHFHQQLVCIVTHRTTIQRNVRHY